MILSLDLQVVFSVHPRTKKALKAFNLWDPLQVDRVYTVSSRPFWETQWLIANAQCTLTDSGGISKESYFHKTKCILLDDQIEWIELVETGWLHIAGVDGEKVINLINSPFNPKPHTNIFGNGNAAELIVDEILKYHVARK